MELEDAAGAKMREATRQGWSEGKEEAIPTEIRYVVQWVRNPPG
jgi:hypothetical protein